MAGEGNFVIAVDLGQQVDPTAACVVERQVEFIERAFDEPEHLDHFLVRALRRWPLHTSYDEIVADIGELIRARGLQEALIVLDLTGPGRVAGRVFSEAYLKGQLGKRWPWAYVISGERVPTRGASIAKKDLVTNALVQFNRGRVHISPDMPYADVLMEELAGYTRRLTASGVSIFENGTRDAPHDDLVFALMLSMFVGVRTDIETCRTYSRHHGRVPSES